MLIACKCSNLIAVTTSPFEKGEKFVSSLENGSTQGSLHGLNFGELQKRQKASRVHSECFEFMRQAIGPLSDLAVTVNQTDLIYEVPIESWSLHYCINCNTITHAKHTSDTGYLINSSLLTNNEEINSLKSSKSFSTTFGILMIDHQLTTSSDAGSGGTMKDNSHPQNVNFSNSKAKQNRIKNLTQHLNGRLQKEILETDERIRRYTEQQFALLKSFREKAEQEYQILVSLVNQVPEQLKVIDAIDNLATTTPQTSPTPTTPNSVATGGADGAIDNTQSLFTFKQQQQQVPSLDTPPATPDSTPMSVGNSPTFRQQTSVFGGASGRTAASTNFAGGTLDSDCLFELEGMENYPVSISNAMSDVEETEDAEDALGELDSAMQIPRSHARKPPSLSIAKSLPISIAAATQGRFNMEDFVDEILEDSNVDIAASIKALAKSVHGDTVFGDLPRPRFSTQI